MARSRALPDRAGHFGAYGGRYVPETLMAPLAELARAYDKARRQRAFRKRLDDLLRHYAGRPTPLYPAARLSESLGGAAGFPADSAAGFPADSAPGAGPLDNPAEG